MDSNFTPQEEHFRQQVRSWLTANIPEDFKGTTPNERIEERKEWQRKLFKAGYVALSWPRQYGGQDMDPVRQSIVYDEMVRAHAPALIGIAGVSMLGPTLISWGTEEQKARYLPKVLTADELWCQGYSEPGAGSDLASLRTRAEIVGDEFVVNGQKVWTSTAQFSDMMFALVRTDSSAPKHRGISYILIDMKTPGITVRPLKQITGESHFNEVFFDNVRVPRHNLVGKLNEGWQVANSTLVHERNMLAAGTTTQRLLDRLKHLAASTSRDGTPWSKDPVFRQRLADLDTRVQAMRYHSMRQLSDAAHGRKAGIESMINKLVGTELNHDITAAAMDVLGDYALLMRGEKAAYDRGHWPGEWMFTLALVIGGGTSQIQKNIISERGLKMPK